MLFRTFYGNARKAAADGLQLAAAIVWAGKTPRGHEFVCLDSRVRDAAQKEGFTVLPNEMLG